MVLTKKWLLTILILVFLSLTFVVSTTTNIESNKSNNSKKNSNNNNNKSKKQIINNDGVNKSFTEGNILLTDINSIDPMQIYEFTTKGDDVHNYTTWLENNATARCVPNDLAFLDDSTLLLLDTQQGIFYASYKGNVKGIWNGMTTAKPSKLGCDLQRFFVSQQNNRIYVTSTDINCDNSYIVGVSIYDLNGNYLSTIENPKFNTTLGVAADSEGTVWVPDVNGVFVFRKDGSMDVYDPISNRIAYNGIQLTTSDTMLIAVPAFGQDLIIEMDSNGKVLNEMPLIGNTTSTGKYSGIPCTIAIDPSNGDIVVETPYATKLEDHDADVIQVYDSKGTFKRSFGGHSCKTKNILCIPQFGLVFIPKNSNSNSSSSSSSSSL